METERIDQEAPGGGLEKVRGTLQGYWVGGEKRSRNIKGRGRRGECWLWLCVCERAPECVTHTHTHTKIIQRQTTQHNVRAFIDTHPQLNGLFIAERSQASRVFMHCATHRGNTSARHEKCHKKQWCLPCPCLQSEAGLVTAPQEPVVFGC